MGWREDQGTEREGEPLLVLPLWRKNFGDLRRGRRRRRRSERAHTTNPPLPRNHQLTPSHPS